MTKAKRELKKLLVSVNKESMEANEPHITSPASIFDDLVNAIDDRTAEYIVENISKNRLTLKTESPQEDGGQIETLIWNIYMSFGAGQNWSTTDDFTVNGTWAIFRHALALLIEQDTSFISVAQSKATNALPALFRKDLQLDFTGNATAEAGGVSFMIDGYTALAGGLRTQAYMLSDALLSKFSQTHNPDVELPLREYAAMRGISTSKDRLRDLKKEVVADLEALASISYRCKERVKGKLQDSGVIHINGGNAFVRNGVIHWNFNTSLVPWLEQLPPIDYARETLTADPRTNKYYFSRYIDVNYRRNEGKDRVETISIKTLLAQSPNIPTIKEVKDRRGSIKQKILEPLFRDLDAIDRLYYDVLDEEKNVVDDPLSCDPETVISSYSIRVDYSEYPAHPQRVKKRKQREKRSETAALKGKE